MGNLLHQIEYIYTINTPKAMMPVNYTVVMEIQLDLKEEDLDLDSLIITVHGEMFDSSDQDLNDVVPSLQGIYIEI